jgi:flagellar biosynthesis/type III secretory pathway protein FliH
MLLSRLQVLRHLPKRFSADVFCALTDSSGSLVEGCERALHLPQDLLSCWVASTPAVLDLRYAKFTALQWSRLLAAIAPEDNHLTEIHIRVMDVGVVPLVRTRRSSTRLPAQPCGAPVAQQQSAGDSEEGADDESGDASKEGAQEGSQEGSQRGSQEGSQEESSDCEKESDDGIREDLQTRHYNEAECNHVLNTLAGVLPQLPSLRHLGLRNVPLQTQVLPALGQVLLALPPSTTALTLTVARSSKELEVGPLQRGMLFSGIASVRSLRELHMPNWEAAVGYDEECMEPLFSLPHLKAVFVTRVKKCGAYPDDLRFKKDEERVEN